MDTLHLFKYKHRNYQFVKHINQKLLKLFSRLTHNQASSILTESSATWIGSWNGLSFPGMFPANIKSAETIASFYHFLFSHRYLIIFIKNAIILLGLSRTLATHKSKNSKSIISIYQSASKNPLFPTHPSTPDCIIEGHFYLYIFVNFRPFFIGLNFLVPIRTEFSSNSRA